MQKIYPFGEGNHRGRMKEVIARGIQTLDVLRWKSDANTKSGENANPCCRNEYLNSKQGRAEFGDSEE